MERRLDLDLCRGCQLQIRADCRIYKGITIGLSWRTGNVCGLAATSIAPQRLARSNRLAPNLRLESRRREVRSGTWNTRQIRVQVNG